MKINLNRVELVKITEGKTSLMDTGRIAGIDSIRFFCAFWVLVSHLGVPLEVLPTDKSSLLEKLWSGFVGNAVNGPAAVIAFFVISGFCIHFSHTPRLEIENLGQYFIRRYFRVVIPLLAALAIDAFLKVNLHSLILWSLYAEMIYYALYPGLLALRSKAGSWSPLIGGAFVLAIPVAIAHSQSINFHQPGVLLTWILGLPCWLMGCMLAERLRLKNSPTKNTIWTWRSGIWAVSVVIGAMRFHSPIGCVWTLPLFGILVFFWLEKEVHHFRQHPPRKALEWAGNWSYSLYLVHMLTFPILAGFGHPLPLGAWMLQILIALILSYFFAIIFEFHAHTTAKKFGKWMIRNKNSEGAP